MRTPKQLLYDWMFPAERVQPEPVTHALASQLHSSIRSHMRSERCGTDTDAMRALVDMTPSEFMALMEECNELKTRWADVPDDMPGCPPIDSVWDLTEEK